MKYTAAEGDAFVPKGENLYFHSMSLQVETIPFYWTGDRSKPTQSATFIVEKTVEETIRIMETVLPNKINSSKFKYNKKYGFYEAKTGLTFFSFGEIVCIKLTGIDNSKTQLAVASQSRLGSTLIDYGKSYFNVQAIRFVFTNQQTPLV